MSENDLPWDDEVSVTSSHYRNSTTSKGQQEASSSYEIAKQESRRVFKQKVLVLLVLFLAAVAVSLTVFFITRNAETDEFEQHFHGGAHKLVASFESIIQEKIGSIGSLCLAFTARGMMEGGVNESTTTSSQNKWPFVTMDSFHERAASARILSKVLHMSVLPLVTEENREGWEEYSVKNGEWYAEGFAYQMELLENGFSLQGTATDDNARARLLQDYRRQVLATPFRSRDPRRRLSNTTALAEEEVEEEPFTLFQPKIFEYTPYWEIGHPAANETPFFPVWQSAPVTALDGINLNVRSFPDGEERLDIVLGGEFALGGFLTAEPGNTSSPDYSTAWYSELLSTQAGKPVDYGGDPLIDGSYPIFANFNDHNEVVGALNFQFSWQTYFQGILPDNARGFVMVLENACDGAYTYVINGAEVFLVGSGDMHDPEFDGHNVSTYLADSLVIHDGSRTGVKINQRGCPYAVHVYPSQAMFKEYHTSMPVVITICILFIFVFTAGMFFIYDRLVEQRQSIVVSTAKESSAIVQSLFPTLDPSEFLSPNQRVKSYLSGGFDKNDESVKPIADLFPHTTVMFADLAGFTAWSSTRDPSQVFTLLQTVYGEFDCIAKRRKVFKVETIGDCYVAVAGLPNPQPNHAVIMARFSNECRKKLEVLVRKLELKLGPDTTDLSMRFGLHSGAVTAGVLRGERARFQLFGDTVNTASRMESTGMRSMIHVSHATANLLVAANKGHWLESREDAVMAKGKGVLNTFWVFPDRNNSDKTTKSTSLEFAQCSKPPVGDPDAAQKAEKTERLVQWMTDLLLDRLKQIVLRRRTVQGTNHGASSSGAITYNPNDCPLKEVVEAIKLPEFDYNSMSQESPEAIDIPRHVAVQLHEHVSAIAAKYNDNPFHNFEHACHVTMAVSKLLGRVVSPDIGLDAFKKGEDAHRRVLSHIHDYTHGINSDPLTLFGIVYSAMIHDLDHHGVSNTQLMKEDPSMAKKYKEKSIAEQHSLDMAWSMLMDDSMTGLRAYLFGNDKSEVLRFRQVVVNIVLATDIFDSELNNLRKSRWAKAFSESPATSNNNDMRATVVLEHIMQASDVSHTMQHWHIYQKWNRRLFLELHSAFQQGRMAANPSKFWFQGELGFFDNYIIPLARKLKECGVFGVSSDECLTYALQNRAEWEARGKEIVLNLIEEAEHLSVQAPVKSPVQTTYSASSFSSFSVLDTSVSDSSCSEVAPSLDTDVEV
ncbi:Receptor-type guanylate cyclase gcy [Seminavis robusta]|uniref:Receptor-type guanylate cyclase gcy n=1 Tax=Seminavis robusta TaxID=568900 RepID=A0A9N8EAM8_9STRA|nr:Receptor-type guanylate cyclase gcy [Seminavis robusta]|eukprot:Sro732_g194450.1 Receptor-type guanylate cyclase gcy (1224) ;mRNA; f:33913-38667